jgi:uncharacterized protein YkwD
VNWVDAAILGIVLVYGLIGYKRGFLMVATELAALTAGYGAALAGFRPLGRAIAATRGFGPGLSQGVAFIVLWVVVYLLLDFALRRLVRRLPEETRKGAANRLWGFPASAIKGVVGAALFVTLLSLSPWGTASADVDRSRLGSAMVGVTTDYARAANNTFMDAFRELQEATGGNPVVEGYRKLPFRTTAVQVDAGAETQMLTMVNRERASRGLKTLTPDDKLRDLARAHARDMLARGYFAHETPEGKNPFQRMRAAKIRYTAAGENLAFALTLEVAHDGLMRSPGHRKNILDPDYRRIGIGALRAGPHGIMFTQEFTD